MHHVFSYSRKVMERLVSVVAIKCIFFFSRASAYIGENVAFSFVEFPEVLKARGKQNYYFLPLVPYSWLPAQRTSVCLNALLLCTLLYLWLKSYQDIVVANKGVNWQRKAKTVVEKNPTSQKKTLRYVIHFKKTTPSPLEMDLLKCCMQNMSKFPSL